MTRKFTKYPSSYISSATATRTPQQAKIHKIAMLMNGYALRYDLDIDNPKDLANIRSYVRSRGYGLDDEEFAEVMDYYNSWLM